MYNPQLNIGLKNRVSVHHYWGNLYKVRGKFSDGAGTYYTEWLVNKDGSMRTLINDSESLYETFNFFSMLNDINRDREEPHIFPLPHPRGEVRKKWGTSETIGTT